MKKIISLVLAIVIVFSITVVSFATVAKYRGDVNLDGNVTSADARKVLVAYVNNENWTMDQTTSGDMNKDAKITPIDARRILQVAVGELPLEEITDEIGWGDL